MSNFVIVKQYIYWQTLNILLVCMVLPYGSHWDQLLLESGYRSKRGDRVRFLGRSAVPRKAFASGGSHYRFFR